MAARYREHGISLLTSVSGVNLNAVATTNLYTGPAEKKFIIDHVRPRNLSATAAAAKVTLGKSTAKTDFLGEQTLSNLNAAGKTTKLMPIPSATPPAAVEYAAGVIFVVDVTVAAGSACTCTLDVFGYLANA